MPGYFWATKKSWEKDLKIGLETRRFSVELVRETGFSGEKCRIYVNGCEIKQVTFKRRNGLAICSSDAQYTWNFDGHSFLLMRTPGLTAFSEFHLFINGVDAVTGQTPWTLWRRRGWLLIYFGIIEILIGILLESLRYLENPAKHLAITNVVGRVVLLFGLLQIIEGLTPILSRNRSPSVYTVWLTVGVESCDSTTKAFLPLTAAGKGSSATEVETADEYSH